LRGLDFHPTSTEFNKCVVVQFEFQQEWRLPSSGVDFGYEDCKEKADLAQRRLPDLALLGMCLVSTICAASSADTKGKNACN
jgi:hypothetical protein